MPNDSNLGELHGPLVWHASGEALLEFAPARASRDMTVPGGICVMSGYLIVGQTFQVSEHPRFPGIPQAIYSIATLTKSASSRCSRILAGLTRLVAGCVHFLIKSCGEIKRP